MAGAKGVLGPSMLYGCTMRLCASAGMPTLVAVGGANVATPLLVSKLGGPLQARMPASSLAARALPIAAHCMIEWGLFQRFKEHLARAAGGRAEDARGLCHRARPQDAHEGGDGRRRHRRAVRGGGDGDDGAGDVANCTASKLLQRAVAADCTGGGGEAGHGRRARDSHPPRGLAAAGRGVVQHVRGHARGDVHLRREADGAGLGGEAARARGFTVAPEPFSEGSVSAETDAAVDAAALGTASHETPAAVRFSPERFARRAAASESERALSVSRRRDGGVWDGRAPLAAPETPLRARVTRRGNETRKRSKKHL